MTCFKPVGIKVLTASIFVASLVPDILAAQTPDTNQRMPGADSAFLRVVMPVGETVRINDQNLVSAPDSPASPYLEVPAGPASIIVSDVTVDLEAAEGKTYSYLWGLGGTGALVEDVVSANDDQLALKIYNLSSVSGLSLWIDDADAAVVADLPAMAAALAMIDIASQISAEVRHGDVAVGVIDLVDILPGQGASVSVWGDADDLSMQMFVDVYE